MTVVRPRLLLVDDDEAMRHLLGGMLEGAFEVVEAGDGAEAIKKLEQSTFSAVLTDLAMPRVDGPALVDWISANRPDLVEKTFILTAGASRDRVKRWLEAFDPRRVFFKPVDADAIIRRIRSILES
jgi:CheY-like chemotaxis protein